ncbi:hypothetical protein WA026_002615 [Henosepilachna vigintioctopunctata]|uniref:CENPJ tubulin-binding region domain-containing protein n=1 Tax=Henosepilachna vigintioctopunctata TaxID=420089 RepID=A0AAW1U1N1_9CUCU
MSMSPHQIFGRLQELKKWQQTHENILRRSNVDEHFEKTSTSYRSYSPNASNNLTENSSKNAKPDINPVFENSSSMQIRGIQGKNFEQILEEKLNEYAENSTSQTCINNTRIKKPFLKKGSGLMKYNLKPEEYKKLIGNKYSNTLGHHQARPKSVQNTKKPVISLPERPKTSGQERQSNNTRKSQNVMRTTKTSTRKNLQRSKATVSVSSKKIEPLKLNSCTKNNKNLKGVQHCDMKKLQHAEEGLKIDLNRSQEPIITEIDRTSPKLKDFIESIMKNTVNSSTFTPLKAPNISIKPKEVGVALL